MGSQVFISHSSKDAAIARRIYDDLRARNLSCWMAPQDVGPGLDYQSAIVQAVRGAKVMLLVFTAHANESREIAKEIALANKYGLRIIPGRLENVTPNDALEYELTTRQWHDLVGDWHESMDGLAHRVRGALEDRDEAATTSAETRSEPPPRPREQFARSNFRQPLAGKHPLVLAAGIALMALGAAHIAIVFLTITTASVALEGEDAAIAAAIFLAFGLELGCGAAIAAARPWGRWPGLAYCLAGALISLWFVILLTSENDDVSRAVFAASVGGIVMFPAAGFVLLRWRP